MGLSGKSSGLKRRVQRHVSAGGVVYRVVDRGIETVLCGRREPPRWSLPKGTPNPGESLEDTAIREVREETGLEIALEAPIDNIRYWFVGSDNETHCDKTVHFYLMSCTGGATDRHDPEFDEVEWFSAEEAMGKITYANEEKVLKKALAMITERASTPTSQVSSGRS